MSDVIKPKECARHHSQYISTCEDCIKDVYAEGVEVGRRLARPAWSGLFNPGTVQRSYDITDRFEAVLGKWSMDSQLLHITSEVIEVMDVLRNKNGMYGVPGTQEYLDKLGEEVADVFLTTVTLAKKLGMTAAELNHYIDRKLDVIEKRVEKEESDK